MSDKIKNLLPETSISAEEFIRLLDAALLSDPVDPLAESRFKRRMDEIRRNQLAAKGEHSSN